MKKAKEWFEEELSGEPLTQESVIEVLKMVQIDTIKETCKRCSESAEVKYTFVSTGDYSGHDKYIIDKNSILQVAEKLKEELE